ncbi:MAG: hypothetical protein KH415_23445 [Clostridium sp.]|nr:hypothetical protein [Clostridium sp.]
MRKVIIPPYKYNEELKTVIDRYLCSKCYKVIKEESREVKGRKLNRSSFIYYSICSECKENRNC